MLALVKLYLMVPLPENARMPIANGVSFATWVHIRSFDSADKCEDARSNIIRTGVGGPELSTYSAEQVKKVLLLSCCIASDDPRLKEPPK